VALLDVNLPDGRGDQVLPDLLARDPFLHVVIITGEPSIETAVSATRNGAFDYLSKPFTPDTLMHVVTQALAARRLAVGRAATERTSPRTGVSQRRLVGSSPEICAVNLIIDRVAKTPSTPVLITGESGTGKEMAAQAIHDLSSRRERPIIKINCSAIPRPLVEAELFGHERGAFTDARETRKGLFELADGGTIFLDEIGELDLGVQPKLLRVLEDRLVTRIGSERPRQLDVRVIAATNRNLQDMCAKGLFRQDLYFRLAVMAVHMPPLRAHREDIEPLAHVFLREKSMELGRKITGFSDEVLDFFRGYSWPGNVRELKNMVERLIILADTDMLTLDEESIRRYCFNSEPPLPKGGASEIDLPGNKSSFSLNPSADPTEMLTLEEMEKRYIRRILERLSFNRTQSALKLGISRSTLLRKINEYGLEEWVNGKAPNPQTEPPDQSSDSPADARANN